MDPYPQPLSPAGRGFYYGSELVCDTAAVAPFTRALRHWDLLRVAVAALGLAVLLMVAAYGFDLTSVPATPEGVGSALALIIIAGVGLLYAWRLGAGGLVD